VDFGRKSCFPATPYRTMSDVGPAFSFELKKPPVG
jgi:hypothetical protein